MFFAGKQALAKQVFVFTEEHTNKNGSCEATSDAKRMVFMSVRLTAGKMCFFAGKQASVFLCEMCSSQASIINQL